MKKYEEILKRIEAVKDGYEEFGGMRNAIDDGEEVELPVEEIDQKLQELEEKEAAVLKEANITESTMEVLGMISKKDAINKLKEADKKRSKGIMHLKIAS